MSLRLRHHKFIPANSPTFYYFHWDGVWVLSLGVQYPFDFEWVAESGLLNIL